MELRAPDRCEQLFDRECFLITDKQTEILGCIPCVMVIFLSTRQAEPIYRPLHTMQVCKMHILGQQIAELKQTDRRTLPNIVTLAHEGV